MSETRIKPKCKLSGCDGNIFSLGAIASSCLEKVGMKNEAKEMRHRICKSHSYEEAIDVICEYVDAR